MGMGMGRKLDRRPFHDSDCTRQQQGLLIYATRHEKSLHRHFVCQKIYTKTDMIV